MLTQADYERVMDRVNAAEAVIASWRKSVDYWSKQGMYTAAVLTDIANTFRDLDEWSDSIQVLRDTADQWGKKNGYGSLKVKIDKTGNFKSEIDSPSPIEVLDTLFDEFVKWDDRDPAAGNPASQVHYWELYKILQEIELSVDALASVTLPPNVPPGYGPGWLNPYAVGPFGGAFVNPPGGKRTPNPLFSPPPQGGGGAGPGGSSPPKGPGGGSNTAPRPDTGNFGFTIGRGAGPLAINWEIDDGRVSPQGESRSAIAQKDHGDERAFGGPGGGSVLSKLRHGGGGHSGMVAVAANNDGLFTHKQRGPRGVNVLAANRGGSGGTAGSGKRNAPGPNPAPGRGTSDNKASASDGRVTGGESRGIRGEMTPSSPTSRPAVAVDGGTTTATATPTPAPNPPDDRSSGGAGSGGSGGSASTSGGSGAAGGSGSTGTSGNSGGGKGSAGSDRNQPQAPGPTPIKTDPSKVTSKAKEPPPLSSEDEEKGKGKKDGKGSNPNPEDDGSGGGGGPRASGGENQSPNPEDSGSGGGGTNPRARISRLMPYDEDGGRRSGTGGGVGGPRAYNAYPDPESSGGGNPRARFEMPNPEDTRGPQGPSARISSNWRGRML